MLAQPFFWPRSTSMDVHPWILAIINRAYFMQLQVQKDTHNTPPSFCVAFVLGNELKLVF
jgi:hypothetical protein